MLVTEPRQFIILVHQEQLLEASFHFILKLLAEVFDDLGQSPEWKITGVVRPIVGNVSPDGGLGKTAMQTKHSSPGPALRKRRI